MQKPSISGQILKWLSVLGERDAGITAQSKERLAGRMQRNTIGEREPKLHSRRGRAREGKR